MESPALPRSGLAHRVGCRPPGRRTERPPPTPGAPPPRVVALAPLASAAPNRALRAEAPELLQQEGKRRGGDIGQRLGEHLVHPKDADERDKHRVRKAKYEQRYQ